MVIVHKSHGYQSPVFSEWLLPGSWTTFFVHCPFKYESECRRRHLDPSLLQRTILNVPPPLWSHCFWPSPLEWRNTAEAPSDPNDKFNSRTLLFIDSFCSAFCTKVLLATNAPCCRLPPYRESEEKHHVGEPCSTTKPRQLTVV